MHAAKAAVEEGIIAGGGAALVQARKSLADLRASLSGDEALGVDVFASALTAPLYWIATNAGLDGSVVVNKVSELPANHGLNAATLMYGDLVADGVIDPVKVTRSAVLNAASVARMVLTTETAIVEKPAEAATTATAITATATRPRPLDSERSTPGPTAGGALFRTANGDGGSSTNSRSSIASGRLVSRHGPDLSVGVGSARTEVFVGDLRTHIPTGAVGLPQLLVDHSSLSKDLVASSTRPSSPLSPCWCGFTCWFFPARRSCA